MRLDHLALSVGDVASVRDWYVSVLDLTVEFAVEDPPTVGLQDDGDFTLILTDGTEPSRCSLYFQVDDVWDAHRRLTERGVAFVSGPRANPWGFGAELHDPDGRLIGLWDVHTMSGTSSDDG